ncbi:MAG: peptidylprolyl isomerase [Candidatus Nanohaloarchaea archaeon]
MAEEVHAKHILVENEEHATQLKRKLEKGEATFEELARKHSDGPSGDDGGDLGYFGRGDMVKPFEREAFDLENGAVSDPVKTKFGWHLIKKVDER